MKRARSPRLAALLAIAAASCASAVAPLTPVRASSVPLLGAQASSLRVARPVGAVLAQLESLFDKRGDHLIAAYPARDGSGDKLYAFKGRREAVVLGTVDTVNEGYAYGETRTYQFGSVFYAVLHAADAQATDVLIVGKPSLNGQELCSDDDWRLKRFEYWCVDSKLGQAGSLRASLQGKDEADTVRGVLLELAQ